jgi:hypothetical protein
MDWHGKETEVHDCSSLERILMRTDGALICAGRRAFAPL